MADVIIPQNDQGFYLNFTVEDSDENAYNLSGYTIKLKVWKKYEPSVLLLTGTCSIVDAASGTCRYLIAEDDFEDVGLFEAELELTKTGIIESTESFEIEVVESG